MKLAAVALSIVSTAVLAQPKREPPKNPGQVLDRQLSNLEREFVSLVEAMPADKFNFVPQGEGFKGVRTFQQQVGHVAASMQFFCDALLGDDTGVTEADEKAGPPKLKTKEDFVGYLKDAFARAHKAMATVTDKNQLEMVGKQGFGFRGTRLGFANVILWHGFDHYGQLVVYLRMNGIVPPASRDS
jgi:uncharacterized damage-inducible protein DinB